MIVNRLKEINLQVISWFQKLKYSEWYFIFAVSLFIHFWQIQQPNSIVFDEVTFGKFISAYAKGEYYFDLHPPMGKLLLAIPLLFQDINTQFQFDVIGTVYSDNLYIWLRSLTAMAGSLLPLLVGMILKNLGFSNKTAVMASFLVIFENALLVISRVYVLDIFLVTLGFASLAFGFYSQVKFRKTFWVLSWVFAAAAFSIKWTGLSFIGVLILWEFYCEKKIFAMRVYKKILKGLLIFFIFYFSVFALHFAMTPKSGIGNDFMTREFQSTLQGSPFFEDSTVQKPSLFSKFLELNIKMWQYHQTMNQSHPYSSKWYTWPIMKRPIYLWQSVESEKISRIYLLGNPLIWWMSFLSVILMVIVYAKKMYLSWKEENQLFINNESFLLILFFANFLPFIFIGRLLFIYHYLVALVAAIMILSVLIERLKSHKLKMLFVISVIINFIFFAPLSYGWPLSQSAYELRLWMSSWM